MTTTPEFLAAELEAGCFGPSMVQNEQALRVKAAAELRRLAEVEEERNALLEFRQTCWDAQAAIEKVGAERDKEKASRQDAQRQLYEERARLYEMVRTEQVKTGQALAERDQLREVIADKNAALDLMRQAADQLRAEVEKLRRGECICTRCGLRQPGESAGPVPF